MSFGFIANDILLYMRSRRNSKSILKALASPVSLCILGAITVWLGISVVKEAYRKHEVGEELSRLKIEITELEQKNSNFSALINSLKDSQTRELEAKRRLNLKRPGEEVAVILRNQNDEPQNIVKAGGEGSSNELDPSFLSSRMTGRPGAPTAVGANPIKWWRYITSGRRD